MSKSNPRIKGMTNEELIRQLVDCERAIRVNLGETDLKINLLKTLYIERQDLLSELDWRSISGEIE